MNAGGCLDRTSNDELLVTGIVNEHKLNAVAVMAKSIFWSKGDRNVLCASDGQCFKVDRVILIRNFQAFEDMFVNAVESCPSIRTSDILSRNRVPRLALGRNKR